MNKDKSDSCKDCVFQSRTFVPSAGSEENAEFVLVGDAPRRAETVEKEPFVGKAGNLLNVVLDYVDIERDNCFITNSIRCKPKNNRTPELKELQPCREHLIKELKQCNANVIVLMGGTAIKSFYNEEKGVGKSRGPGDWSDTFDAFVVPTYHPSSIFYNPRSFIDFVNDLKTAKFLLDKNQNDLPSLDVEYKILKTPMQCIKMINWFKKQDLISIDLETKGFKWYEDEIIAIGMTAFKGKSYIIPKEMIRNNLVITNLRKLLEDPSVDFLWQGGQFDCRFFKYQHDIDARIDEDTLLKHYCIDERRGTHDLAHISQLYLGAEDYESDFKSYIPRGGTYDDAPKEKLHEYLAKDTDYPYKLNEIFNERITEDYKWIYDNILIPATNMLVDVEMEGFKLDFERNKKLAEEYEKEIKKLKDKIDDIVYNHLGWDSEYYVKTTEAKSKPDEFNVNSPQQLSHVLYDLIGFDEYKGNRTTEREALDHFFHNIRKIADNVDTTRNDLIEVIHEGGQKGEVKLQIPPERLEDPVNCLLNTIIVWRRYDNIYTKFIDAMSTHAEWGGRVHCQYKLYGTETGRLSSSSPNMQNIPRDKTIRGQFIAKDGYKVIEADYSQAELRTLAFLSQDEALLGLYQEGKDLHDETTKDIFGEDFTYEQRSITKSINFGIPYGRGHESIAEQFDMTNKEAKKYVEKWKNKYSGATQWLEEQQQKVLDGKTVKTAFGRTREFGYISRRRKHHVMREVVNFPIQSTASDFLLLSAIHLHNKFEDEDINLVNLVHDAILFEVKANKIYEYGKQIKEVMEWVPNHYQDVNLPFVADVEVGERWGSTKEIDFEEVEN